MLLLKDASKEFWDVPGGRINGGETFNEALQRELSEELPGIQNIEIGRIIASFRVPGSIKNK